MALKLFDSRAETVRNKLPPIKCEYCGKVMLEGTVMCYFPGLICECGAWSTDNRREERCGNGHRATNWPSATFLRKRKKKNYYS